MNKGVKLFLLVCVLLFPVHLGCAQQKRISAPQPVVQSAPVRVAELNPNNHKLKIISDAGKWLPEERREYVTLKGEQYEVLRPWQGHRIEVDAKEVRKSLVLLSPDVSFAESNIYVTAPTAAAFLRMAAQARLDGVELLVDSGYRSPSYQRHIFERLLDEGKDFDEIAMGVAPPGYSEHMSGTAVDLVPSDWSFHTSEAERWMLENGNIFGFFQSYPEKSSAGFTWEPWHWRYIEKKVAGSH